MRPLARARSIALVAVVCLAAGLVAVPVHGQAGQPTGDISVVVHPDVAVDNLTMAELRRYLTGDREFWGTGGPRVTIFIRAPIARARDTVVRDVCQMTEAQFRQHWIGKVFRNETPSAPKIAYSNDAVLEQVGRTPGAIGFIEGPVTAKSVKVLRVDGRLPGQPGYRLK
jgi:hypothetical protein